MKKILSVLATTSIMTAATSSVVACNSGNNLIITFIPSRDPIEVLKTVKPLENLLKAKLKEKDSSFSMNIKIITSTSYEAAGEALKNGKTALVFLPTGTYSNYRGTIQENGTYDKAGVLLSAARASMIPDLNYFKNNLEAAESTEINPTDSWGIAKEYNEITDKHKITSPDQASELLENQTEEAQYYRSLIYANKDFLAKNNYDLNKFTTPEEYKTATVDLLQKALNDKKLFLGKGTTSNASVLYPLLWMKNTLGIEDDNTIAQFYTQKQEQQSYTQIASSLATGQAAIGVGYGDIRRDILNSADIQKAYEKVAVIGASNAILNDGIEYSRQWFSGRDDLLANLRTSFKDLIADKNNKNIFDVYSHTSYSSPADNATGPQITAWEANLDLLYTNANKVLKPITDIIKDVA
ncbi:PhnD/SsuA/transferrin family substrate-binding protein [Spiroplasma chrysopicola]|uniref:Phosphonate ABC transporter, phosphonate-binding protein n=1 Tax=Spiroplasma chrysopicola DF-1 TaxID=1276227 RepID=R4U2I7_9MOLU|nr:PhnD/SsuA/transferrin family substrate-binding protein [Spiroplasma chrysopicola]AGM25587.1 phosphonate ABC transporter, phosphonate-binding protein [Spiroplasma chrysopicola DF-1]